MGCQQVGGCIMGAGQDRTARQAAAPGKKTPAARNWAAAPDRTTPAARKRNRHCPVGGKRWQPRHPHCQVVTSTFAGVARSAKPEDMNTPPPRCYRSRPVEMAKQVAREDIGMVCEQFFLQDKASLMMHRTVVQDYWEKKSAPLMEHQGECARISHRTARHQEFPRHNRNRFS